TYRRTDTHSAIFAPPLWRAVGALLVQPSIIARQQAADFDLPGPIGAHAARALHPTHIIPG
ncbi:hypothetical protein, partial [Acidovorax sp. SRB_24]|uniref:hypothetical protein n=1 Tax=Acidovorax sp. SRB_24 TaxID=1962700 RepID=UPI00197B8D73